MLGFDILNKVGREKDCVDEPWFMEIQHIVLSHHGQEEYGAPVRPATREALIVHHVDLLDSRLKILDEALASVDVEGFSSYNKWLEGRAYAGCQSPAKEDKENGDA
jgi:3'-5' exoribonuclease